MEYNVKPAAKTCSATGREIQPGETFFSALFPSGDGFERKDYCEEAWKGRPDGAFASWRCQAPENKAVSQKAPATDEQLLEYFDQLLFDPDEQDKLYILALLLIRRKLFRGDEDEIHLDPDSSPKSTLTVYCPARDQLYSVPVLDIPIERQDEIQAELEELLYGKSEPLPGA